MAVTNRDRVAYCRALDRGVAGPFITLTTNSCGFADFGVVPA